MEISIFGKDLFTKKEQVDAINSGKLLKDMSKEELELEYKKTMDLVAGSENEEIVILAMRVARSCRALLFKNIISIKEK